ncbi:MAG: hypothetical protein KDD78_10600, partial [Caldilineaceae bacterium]|nr:hypothetical protein [Caldilineaceae bacterium]
MVDSMLQPAIFSEIGRWVSLLITLFLLTTLVRDNGLARLAQHVLVGTAMGYLFVLIWRTVLLPQVITPLLAPSLLAPSLLASSGVTALKVLAPLVLIILLLATGVDQIVRQDSGVTAARPAWLVLVGALPVALLVGANVAVALLGAIQGTLAPQFLRAAAIGVQWPAAPDVVIGGLLTLFVTSGALLHFWAKPDQMAATSPSWMRSLLLAWSAIGKRG